jgi:VanZ family protein
MQPVVLALALLALGVGIEVAQSFTPDREPSAWDVLADVVGMALGWRFRSGESEPVSRRL